MTNDYKLKVKMVKDDAKLPTTQIEDAGFDLYPCFSQEYIIIHPHETTLIPTGIAIQVPKGKVAIIFERSSTGKMGLGRRAGVVDPSYRGEIFVGITNTGTESIAISKDPVKTMNQHKEVSYAWEYKHAIGQFIIFDYDSPELLEVDELEDTERGEQALGHTNVD